MGVLVLWVAFLMVFFSHAMVLVNHPVKSVLSLMGCFIGASVLWLIMSADFLAFVLIFVYVGAVMTLFLFMVMMLNTSVYTAEDAFGWPTRILVVLFCSVMPVSLWVIWSISHQELITFRLMWPGDFGSTASSLFIFSKVLYQEYFSVLQVLGLILMIPLVVASGLVRRGQIASTKSQDRGDQVAVSPRKRLTMVRAKKGKI